MVNTKYEVEFKKNNQSSIFARAPNKVQENQVREATLAVIKDLLKDNIDPRPTCSELGTMVIRLVNSPNLNDKTWENQGKTASGFALTSGKI